MSRTLYEDAEDASYGYSSTLADSTSDALGQIHRSYGSVRSGGGVGPDTPITHLHHSATCMPEIMLRGRRDEPLADLYWRSLARLATPTDLLRYVKSVAEESFRRGQESAREAMRVALGIEAGGE